LSSSRGIVSISVQLLILICILFILFCVYLWKKTSHSAKPFPKSLCFEQPAHFLSYGSTPFAGYHQHHRMHDRLRSSSSAASELSQLAFRFPYSSRTPFSENPWSFHNYSAIFEGALGSFAARRIR
jgi:hypothetical protein